MHDKIVGKRVRILGKPRRLNCLFFASLLWLKPRKKHVRRVLRKGVHVMIRTRHGNVVHFRRLRQRNCLAPMVFLGQVEVIQQADLARPGAPGSLAEEMPPPQSHSVGGG